MNKKLQGTKAVQHSHKLTVAQQDGVLVVNKPKGITSAKTIAHIKHTFGQKKIGHAGTLDPMAQGVLLVLLGQGTKLSGYLMDSGRKVYAGSIQLGVITDTWDMEGTVLAVKKAPSLSQEELDKIFQEFIGTYEQEVPAYSAAKHNGKPLYELARKGLKTPVKKKTVTIFSGQAELVGLSHVTFRVECSSGTYIRSLAHSLGTRLGCGAALEKLIREYSYPFGIDMSVSTEELQAHPEKFMTNVQPIAAALPGWPRICITVDEASRVQNGMSLPFTIWRTGSEFCEGIQAIFELEDATPVALVTAKVVQGKNVWVVSRGLWNQ